MNGFQRRLFLFTFFSFSIFHDYGLAEQTMDSADALSVAETTASNSLKAGRFQEALQAQQNALQIGENRYGPTHPSLVPLLINLATIDRYLALYPEAESNLQWALAIQEKNSGMDGPLVAGSLTNLASLYFDWGRWGDAEFFQKKVLDSEKDRKTNPVFFIESIELLGQIELELGKKDAALSLLKEGDKFNGEIHALQPSGQIQYLNHLAAAYHSLQNFSEEGSCLEKALQVAKDRCKPNSIELADAMERLADLYRSQNRLDEAKQLYASALNIYKGLVGTYFGYSSLPYVQKLAKADESIGLWKDAQDLLQKSLQTSKEAFGDRHPRVAVALLDLAKAQEGSGQKDKARENLKQALEIALFFYKADHPLVVQIQSELDR